MARLRALPDKRPHFSNNGNPIVFGRPSVKSSAEAVRNSETGADGLKLAIKPVPASSKSERLESKKGGKDSVLGLHGRNGPS
jgi:hypothetical protein